MKSKKSIFIAIGLALIVASGAVILLFCINKQLNVGEFDVAEYQREIESFSLERNVGQISDADTAIKRAKELWIELYSTVNGKPYDPIKGRECEVFFDRDNDCWLIKIVLPSNTKGIAPHAIIQKNGTVLAVWLG